MRSKQQPGEILQPATGAHRANQRVNHLVSKKCNRNDQQLSTVDKCIQTISNNRISHCNIGLQYQIGVK